MGQKSVERTRDDGAAADLAVLLWAVGLAGALAASGGDDHDGDFFHRSCHGWHTSSLAAGSLAAPALYDQCFPKYAAIVGIGVAQCTCSVLKNVHTFKLLGFCA